MEEEIDLPIKTIKEECVLFEEDRTQAFYENSQYGYFSENCQPIKKEEKDPLGDIEPEVEPDERLVDESQLTEKADVNEPSSLLKICLTAANTSTWNILAQKSYLGAENETKHKNEKGQTKNKHSHREGDPTCTESPQEDLGSQDVYTGSCNEPGEGRMSSYNNIRVPASDELLHCQKCSRLYQGDCPEHGPLLVVDDTPVSHRMRYFRNKKNIKKSESGT